MQKDLAKSFSREIARLIKEIDLYKEEASLWLVDGEVNNSAGTLALHLAGNLKSYIGASLGNTGYVRKREAEFSERNIPKAKLIENLKEASLIVEKTVGNLSAATLAAPFPNCPLGEGTSVQEFLLHLFWHLSYHQGQVSYHRRLLAKG
jgi:uncharacterized damage-inducible protein DinB